MKVLDWNRNVIVVGEVGQAHDGSLGTAHAFIDAIADAGADAVKFQTHIAAAESRTDEPWRVNFSYQDDTRYEYWKRMEFTAQGWAGLRRHTEDRGLAFLSSPFSLEAVELLRRVGVAAWKVASGEVTNVQLLEAVARTGRPVMLSSGMSSWAELDGAVERLRGAGAGPLAVLQCTSAYPTAPDRLGLNVLGRIRERYDCPTGLSDHSGTIYPSLASVALGGRVVEVHVTLSREMFGPDVPASVTSDELRTLVDGVRYIDAALAAPVDKDAVAVELAPLRTIFGRSLVVRRPLPAGHVLTAGDLSAKKPGGGIPPERLEEILGSRLRRALHADEPLCDRDIETAPRA
ncbi:N-acetylneuraminate synthase family protein [Embleya sp. NPDC005971]|uniref:N-acetylneuraminate synthase family protein n=1 Tax=Embleya sp. NPDC005971 TaxID=3156724 RepID=UPI0033C397FA